MRNERAQVDHDPLKAASATHPFGGSETWELLFDQYMEFQAAESYLPRGYGFHEAEGEPWDDLEGLIVGKRTAPITLPHDPWWFRALVWVRGLEGMTQIWDEMEKVVA